MRSPGSCVRCLRPLDVESASGLCLTCRSAIDTPGGKDPAPLTWGETSTFQPAAPNNLLAPGMPVEMSGTLRAPETPPHPGLPSSPPGYELLEKIDGGGMGIVYLAREHASDRVVAMKFLRGVAIGSAIERFIIELRVLAKLDHPNIVRVYANDFLRSDPFFTMEYQPGGTLAELVKKRGPLPAVDAVKLMRAVASAIQVAHANGVLHRDLKPSNVLLSADGIPKVSDFGLAKRTDQDDQITDPSGAVGTPGYMPPEQVSKRKGEMGFASDVYGLGATLYHLLTGRPPFTGETQAETMSRVVSDPPTRPRALRPEIPLALEAVVMKCLEKNPADRYQTAAALVAGLDKFLAGGDPDAPQLTRWRRLRRWTRRNRRGLAASAVVVLLFAGVFALGAAIWPGPSRSTPLESPVSFEEAQTELAAGRKVVFIPSKGKPRAYQWILGGSVLTTSETGDGSCSYEAMGISLLELCPDPMTDRYLIRAKIRFVQTKVVFTKEGIGQPDKSIFAGVYFARNTAAGNDGLIVHRLFAVNFNDTTPLVNRDDSVVQLRGLNLCQRPNQTLTPGVRGNKWTKIDRPPDLPGPWRTIEIEVTPERVKVRWEGPDGTMIEFANLTGDQIREEWAELHKQLADVEKNHGVEMPEWSPRAPIGIWNQRATIDVKDVSVTPLK